MAAVNGSLMRPRRVERILRQFGAAISESSEVLGPLIVHNAEGDYARLTVGPNVHVGRMVLLDLASEIIIEQDATVSMGVTILTHLDVGSSHARTAYHREVHPTIIGAGSYIGANATILAGCDVGQGAVVAAGAVVTRPVEENTLVAGVPALLKSRRGDC